jgi:hypothetical protein
MVADLAEARFVDFCLADLYRGHDRRRLLVDVDISGYVDRLVVNGSRRHAYVDTELDRRHPERVQLRDIRDSDGFRAMWQTVESLWADTTQRARLLPEQTAHERVDGEWSFVETLRHLVFITDSWASRTILDECAPSTRWRCRRPPMRRPTAGRSASTSTRGRLWPRLLEARADRQGVVPGILDDVTDADLAAPAAAAPAPVIPRETAPWPSVLAVVMEEECEHHRFATRDLAVLQAR